ncbi:unnamed protein product [Prorocentrum cordatum]|uniref:Uncharacterized protein n=1 Tax=Prorocentrum cordatum TaxID=2364126 RepID=A0ABN9WP57_9DINO|nr:unnamed protein product [Polarella glacialis]
MARFTLAILLLSARALADAGCVADGTCPTYEADTSALLQSRASRFGATLARTTCPGSNTSCAGNQCCPRTPGQHGGDKTFPCPSADAGWDGCGAIPHVPATSAAPARPGSTGGTSPSADDGWDGCETGVAALVQADTVTCPGSNTSCAGNQCCPRTPGQHGGDKIFPCPSADDGWDGCETGVAALM